MTNLKPLPPDDAVGRKYNFNWQQTMLRIKDPAKTVPFFQDNFGMKTVHKYDFNEYGFSLYFLERPKDSEIAVLPPAGTAESERYLWNMQNTTLELTHNHGSEKDDTFAVNNGNEEPHRGFGHIAFNCDDVYKATEELLANGVQFRKKPDEGRMKGLAFALSPEGYWIEIVKRGKPGVHNEPFNLSQTMKRVKDPAKSVAFYRDVMGMTLVRVMHANDFSLYFMASIPKEEAANVPTDPESPEAAEYMKNLWQPVLELTHNHGTEKDDTFTYHNGNDQPQGYGHIGFLVDDLEAACASLEQQGVPFKKKPQDGKMRGIAFAYDPDKYWVELIQRGATFTN
ncbi:unnamed protein product [Vitrella brassicaformis CCMP3155]|uniref:lactoylglutathione lyase n=1 Tax=Vitrella brassicaformis (strain CCMP3155) TaxID=1169540 RepID=A0A0G4EBF7_VITBC|nr:unnamed protein product [Vitrella brassicaformis CCMP3155]|eukprot:CEL93298.1 unnamed protein product [Vitrella brassicaformis CCMP3155]